MSALNDSLDRLEVLVTAKRYLEARNLLDLELDEDGVVSLTLFKIMDGLYSIKGVKGDYLFDVGRNDIDGTWYVTISR